MHYYSVVSEFSLNAEQEIYILYFLSHIGHYDKYTKDNTNAIFTIQRGQMANTIDQIVSSMEI